MTAGPVAIIPVRDGVLAAGGHEVAAEVAAIAKTTSAGPGTDARTEPRTILIGSVLGTAAGALAGLVRTVSLAEVGDFRPAAWAAALAPLVADATALVLPASPDGRDLGARLAAELNWPLLSNAMTVAADRVVVVHHGGLVQSVVRPDGPFVATLQPGVRGVEGSMGDAVVVETLDLAIAAHTASAADAELIEIEAADATTIDLAEASRIVGGGAGLLRTDDPDGTFAALTEVGASIGAAMGATRVVTDAGPVSHARQIGTTGVVVNPELYVAFGISGAVQHTAGLGDPRHVISVNTEQTKRDRRNRRERLWPRTSDRMKPPFTASPRGPRPIRSVCIAAAKPTRQQADAGASGQGTLPPPATARRQPQQQPVANR